MRTVEGTVDRCAHDFPPFRGCQVGEFGLPADRGVVDQHVQPPEPRDDGVDKGFGLRVVGYIGEVHVRLPARFVNQAHGFAAIGLRLAGGDHHAETVARQMLGDRPADVHGAAGDQGHLG